MDAEGVNNCVFCLRGLYNRRYQYHVLTPELSRNRPQLATYIQQRAVLEVAFDNQHRICHRCWQRAIAEHRITIPAADALGEDIRDPIPAADALVEDIRDPIPPVEAVDDHIQDPVPAVDDAAVLQAQELFIEEYVRAPNSSRSCIYNNCINGSRHRIPEVIKIHIFCTSKIYIPHNARMCLEHLQSNSWDELPQFCNTSHMFTAAHFNDLLDILRQAVQKKTRIDFRLRGGLTDTEMHFWTGFNCQQFTLILQQTQLSRVSKKPRTALGIYMTKLRTGEPNQRLSTLFNMSRASLERFLVLARKCLIKDYVGRHLGLNHITRDELLAKNLTIPKTLFGDDENSKIILIFDGTYIYIQKSSNFLFQRETYSTHKFKNLLKPFLIVCSDGYILDVIGPKAATKSDASIMTDIMNKIDHPLHYLVRQNDVFILDRGFRDSLGVIEQCGYEHHEPQTKYPFETQLTTEQANESRMVTMCRWVVEVVNGRFKRDFKLFRQVYFNRALPKMFKDFKIAAALLNHFHIPIEDTIYANAFIEKIRESINSPNRLYNYVNNKRLNSHRVDFIRMEANELGDRFPRLTQPQIIIMSLGTYQLKLARSYCSEHLHNGLYLIETYRENALADLAEYGIDEDVWLLRGRIQSRHVRARIYFCYILVKNDIAAENVIYQTYCSCLSGRRTIGTCAHIISIIWYLGHAKYEGFLAPAMFLNDVIVDDETDSDTDNE